MHSQRTSQVQSYRACMLTRMLCCGCSPLQQEDSSALELYSVYVPTNHIYVGDIFLLGKEDVIHTNLSVREGLGAHSPAVAA